MRTQHCGNGAGWLAARFGRGVPHEHHCASGPPARPTGGPPWHVLQILLATLAVKVEQRCWAATPCSQCRSVCPRRPPAARPLPPGADSVGKLAPKFKCAICATVNDEKSSAEAKATQPVKSGKIGWAQKQGQQANSITKPMLVTALPAAC